MHADPTTPDLGHEDFVTEDAAEQGGDQVDPFDAEVDELVDESYDESSALDRLQTEHTELKDKYLRLMAEFDNFRKRTARQRNEERATAAIGTMNSLLPVVDDFDRAKATAEKDDNDEALSPGIELVYQKLKRVLGTLGLKQMESTGAPFDPELHEAFTEIPAPSPELVGKVVDTIEPGYFLNDKLIRHAKVVVGK